MALNLKNP